MDNDTISTEKTPYPYYEKNAYALNQFVPIGDIQWMKRSAPCNGASTIFYAPEGERQTRRLRREGMAKQICADCSVQPQCLKYARDNGELFGVWGGETELERYRAGFLKARIGHVRRRRGEF